MVFNSKKQLHVSANSGHLQVITWRWPLLAETCSYFLLLNTIVNPYYHSCGFMTDIYLTISLSVHFPNIQERHIKRKQKKKSGRRNLENFYKFCSIRFTEVGSLLDSIPIWNPTPIFYIRIILVTLSSGKETRHKIYVYAYKHKIK